MRVLMVTDFYHPFLGGVETHVRGLSHGLVERGHQVTVATLGRAGLPDFEIDHGVRIRRINGTAQRLHWLFRSAERPWAQPFPDPELSLALRRIVAEEEPDVVHGHDWLARSMLPFRPQSVVPFVVSLHYYTLSCAKKSLMYDGSPCSGPQPTKCIRCTRDHYGTAKGLATLSGNWLSAAYESGAIDMFLPVSQATALGNGLVGSKRPYQVVPNFVPSRPDTPGADLQTYADQLPDEPFLLFVGDFRRDKGLDVLLQAYAGLNGAPPLVLIGKVWSETPTEFPPNTVVLKNWPNYAVMEAWRRCCMAIVPSRWAEPFGIVVIEAMVSGRPVIASGTGGIPDLVIDGETGILVPPGDPVALRSAMKQLIDDPDLRDRMGEAGKTRVVAFQSDTVIETIEHVYNRLVERRKSEGSITSIRHEREVPPFKSESAITENPLVSIVINNYNYGRFLEDAIKSALNQTYPHTEVVVVDDGSTDDSRDVIERYADRVLPIFKENGGQASAFNTGFAHCHGDIVIFLDSDDFLLAHIAAEVAGVFQQEPKTAKVQYRLMLVDSDGKPMGLQTPPAELQMPDGDLRHQILRFPDDVRTPPTSGNAFSAATLRHILPTPEPQHDSVGADLYLFNVAPLYGLIKSLASPGGCYRVHGANLHYTSGIDTNQMRRVISRSVANREYLLRHAQKLCIPNLPASGSQILSVTLLINRLASIKLEPQNHPIDGDAAIKVAWLGILASMRRDDVRFRTRALYTLWFVAAAASPKPLTRWLVSRAFNVDRRGVFGKFAQC